MNDQNTDIKSLAHTKWNCKYHVCLRRSIEGKFFKMRRERTTEK